MINLWLNTLTDEQLQNIATAPRTAWIAGSFVSAGRGCVIGNACGLIGDAAVELYDAPFGRFPDLSHIAGRFDDGFERFGQRLTDAIQDRARRILAARSLARMDGPREAVEA